MLVLLTVVDNQLFGQVCAHRPEPRVGSSCGGIMVFFSQVFTRQEKMGDMS